MRFKVASDGSKVMKKPLKRPSTLIKNNVSANANGTIKAKSTPTKITKLVLKPKPTTRKSSLMSKVTKKNYNIKPVTIKSRSTMISHESTFCIRNIKKPSNANDKRPNVEDAKILVKNEQYSRQLIVNGNIATVNEKFAPNHTFEMVNNEHSSANLTSQNTINIVNSPILQEITHTVVNGMNVLLKSPKKNCENNVESSQKSYGPIKVRQFIRMQKKQRIENDTEKPKPPATKEEIQQRLLALRENSLNILKKNVQKARNTNTPSKQPYTPKCTKVTMNTKQKEKKGEAKQEEFFLNFDKFFA